MFPKNFLESARRAILNIPIVKSGVLRDEIGAEKDEWSSLPVDLEKPVSLKELLEELKGEKSLALLFKKK